ncbi:hypothetical protein RclHR1_20190001 [Rhizophagus clarus]|uniref:Protein far1-related sequence 5-like n=1 Tax=Rhizophagus clarus TaxID=94130 RepID=A0A2Z6R484_9GLOM|nr:hypothetical protein RclHR1_20190001 [Rhizophagus clarus]
MNQAESLNIIKMHETEQRNIHETNQHSIDDNESDESDEPSDSLDLTTSLTFSDWEDFKAWMHRFVLKKGFSYKIRMSEYIEGVLRRVTYECTKSGFHISQATSDLTKKRNTHSQRTSCPWRVNLTYPKTSNIVKINSFNDVYNHPLTSMIQEIAPRFQKLTQEMLADVEKYVIQGHMDSISIYPLLKHDYLNQPIHRKDLYNTVYQFRKKNNLADDLNLQKKLKGKLGSQFEEFHYKFYVCWNSLCEELFELRWNQLIEQYPAAAKYLSNIFYNIKDSWAVPWIRKKFTAGVQSTQRIESINRHIHDKVNRSTSLCNLLISITDHVKNNEYLENFEVERNALPTIGMPMLNERFFSRVDAIIKKFLTPVMLGKQRSQMNQSVCYDINQITEWHHLIEMKTDNEEISVGIREQKQDTKQILLRSLVSNLPIEAILKAFIYDIQSRLEKNSIDVNNLLVIKHKGRPPKRLVANVEKGVLHKEKKVLKDSSAVNVIEGQSRSNLENSTNIIKS